MTVEAIETVAPPERLYIPPGLTFDEYKAQVLAEMETFRKETETVIPDDIANRFEYLNHARRYWEEQYQLAALDIRKRMGEGQRAVRPDGRRFANRLRFWKETYEVKGHFEDQLRPR